MAELCQKCGLVFDAVNHRNPACPSCHTLSRPKPPPIPVEVSNGVLYLQHSQRGLGVYTSMPFQEGQLVERCPVFVLEGELSETLLKLNTSPYSEGDGISFGHLLFPWVVDEVRALVLGYAMLYNHEPVSRSNLRYEPYIDPKTNRRFLDFRARRGIVAGEELTQTYAASDRLWFDYR